MKLSLNWIKDYVKIPKTIKLPKIVSDLTMSTVEVEGWEELAPKFDNMVIGILKEVLPHPNADKLRICKVDLGEAEEKQIVCGGINLNVGMKIVVTKPGAMVRWHGTGDLEPIGIAKLRGVESYGMIVASEEIGLSELFPVKNEAEIMDLSHLDVNAGTLLSDALNLDDTILEIDNKSLTNRPDLWGHYGIAREIAALYDLPFEEIKEYKIPETSEFKVVIENPDKCPRYIGVKLEGMKVLPSTYEIQKRLWSVGARPINAIVDVTNYVMLAVGQPTHAFDSDNIRGGITVRSAKKGETLLLLDEKELELTTDDLVIADDDAAVALAGVMGGAKDSILESTEKVILEVANFEAKAIRKTSTRYETRTEAATRYEKALDPERCDLALSLAMQMFSKIYPEMIITGYNDNYLKKLKRIKINVSLKWLESRLGKKLTNIEITRILEKLGFEINIKDDNMLVTAPTWRSTGDIELIDDILEEVARMHGYDNFEPTLITTSFEGAINQPQIDIDRKIREYLAIRCGMQEVYTYPWVSNEYIEIIHQNKDEMLSLSTPPSPEERYIRSSLLPNLCKAVSANVRYKEEFAIFESAQVFFDKQWTNPYDKKELLPLQRRNIAGALVGSKKDVDNLFRKTKGIIESVPRYVHMEEITFKQDEKPYWADNTVWLNIIHNNKQIGNLALLSKKAALACGIKNNNVMLFEMDIDSLNLYASRTNGFSELPEYPMIDYDLSLLVDQSVKWEQIEKIILEKKNELLRNSSYLGEYKGEQVPEGKKSITFRLVIGSLEKTLTSEEIENVANNVIKKLNKTLGAELRQ